MTVPLTTDAFGLWARACVAALGVARAEIDALNVFPVPDSDTGTNVYLTYEAAATALSEALVGDASLDECVKAYVDGALLGARGNSGVIMAQLLRGAFGSLATGRELGGAEFARAFVRASDAAYAAVGVPQEGTILSVARAAAESATATAERGGDVAKVLRASASAAQVALARTPEQLEALARAGVVDAGGRALVVVFDTTERVLTGRWQPGAELTMGTHTIAVPTLDDTLDPDGPAYEVMYLLDADDGNIGDLRQSLGALGDSLVVVGGEGLWNVHVHTDEVGAAIEAGIVAGRPYRIVVTHFAEQQATVRARHAEQQQERAVVVAAAGRGLADLFEAAGARVIEFAVGDRLPISRVVDAIRLAGARDVIVLPNGSDHIAACEAAARQARDAGTRVAVLPTHTQVQGMSAIAVHEPGRDFDDDVIAMTAAAAQTRHGAITIASESGITMAGPCRPGDVLGVVDAEFAIVGDDMHTVAMQVVQMLMSGSAELVTLVTGDGADPAMAAALRRSIRQLRPDVDTVLYDGGQGRYPLLLAVE